jgi:hypothetical protein
VGVKNDGLYESVCISLVEALAAFIRPHTWALASSLANNLKRPLEDALAYASDDRTFIDVVDPARYSTWPGGKNEVRVVLWDCQRHSPVPDELLISDAQLEVLIIPSDLADYGHAGRRFLDTRRHVDAAHLLERVTE